MLLKIREVTAGKFSYFIIAVISVPFALWGINYYFQGGDGPVVIEVDSTEITLGRYNEAFNQTKRRLEASLGPDQTLSNEDIRQDAISVLLRTELLNKIAEKYHYQVTDAEVAEAIVKAPAFMNEGRFDRQQYINLLHANRQSQPEFEENIRNQLRRGQLQRIISQSSFTLPYEQDRYNRFLFHERHVRYLEFPMENFIDRDSVSSTEVRVYYEDHKEDFLYSDAFYLRYIELKKDDIAAELIVEDDDVRAYYDDNPDLFTVPEQRTVAHILIDPARHEAAAARAREVHEKLERGESFADLAKTYSDDSLTVDQGGELLPLTREDLDATATEVIFTLEPGEFSAPMAGDFGLQIFKLLSIGSTGVKTFEEVRDVVEEEFRNEEAEKMYSDSFDQIEEIIYDKQDGLFSIPHAVELVEKVEATGLIKVDEKKGIFQYPAVVEAAYTDDVKKRQNDRVIEVEPGHIIVLGGGGGKGGAYRPGKQKTFEEVEREIIEILIRDKAWEQASRAAGEATVDLLEEKTTLDNLAGEQSFPLHEAGFIRRGGLPEAPAVEWAAFLMGETTPSYVNVKMQTTESYAVIELGDVRDREKSETEDDEESKTLSFGVDEFNAVLLGILEESKVKVHNDRLEN